MRLFTSAKDLALILPLLVLAALLCPFATAAAAAGTTAASAINNINNPLISPRKTSSTAAATAAGHHPHRRFGRGQQLAGMVTTGTTVGGACAATSMTLRETRRWRGTAGRGRGFTAGFGQGDRRRTWGSAVSGWSRAHGRSNGGAGSLRCVCAIPPPGISALGWDVGMSTACVAASVVWVKLWTGLARHDKIKPQVSRKIVHATAAPLFMALWPFFTARPCARFFAAAVPLIQAARLTVAGLSGNAENGDASSNELVKGISRSGRASETLGGPLKYALMLVALTALEWRSSVVGVVAILQLAVGDGLADLVGRQIGRHKWQEGGSKSVEGTVAFASSSFLASMATIAWFHRFGVLAVSPAEAAGRVAAVSAACAAVELLPPRLAGDDNFSVPVAALTLGKCLFR